MIRKLKLRSFFHPRSRKFNRQQMIVIALVVVILGVGFLLFKKFYHPEPKQIYEVAIMVRDQHNSDPEEDRRTSLKKGDVLVVHPEGHNWSRTEKISYLILKMKLTKREAEKLMRPEEEELSRDERKKRLEEMTKDRNLNKEEIKKIEEELKQERKMIRARLYKIDLNELGEFKPVDLLKGQPFQDKVYDWSIVEKK